MHPRLIYNVSPSSETQPFPRCLLRLATTPANGVRELHSAPLAESLAQIDEAALALDAAGEAAADRLYSLIGGLDAGDPNERARGGLLRLQRDMRTRKRLHAESLDRAAPALDAVAERLLARYVRAAEALKDKRTVAEALFESEVHAHRDRFRVMLCSTPFQHGLALSSTTLFAAQRRYVERAGSPLRSKDRKTERGLLRYYLRAATKSTPFGQFCSVVGGVLDPAVGGSGLAVEGYAAGAGGGSVQSVVSLNKRLFRLVKNVVQSDPEARGQLLVGLNPTLRSKGGVARFVASFGRREVFQSMKASPLLSLITSTVADTDSLSFNGLHEALIADDRLDAAPDQIEGVLTWLLQHGAIELRYGVSDQDRDWDLALGAVFTDATGPTMDRVRAFLGQIRAAMEGFLRADPTGRVATITEARRVVDEFLEGRTITVSHRDLPFYEDATSDVTFDVDPERMTTLLDDLRDYTARTLPIAWPRRKMSEMRTFYDRVYGLPQAGAAPGDPPLPVPEGGVPLLDFYEVFYRQFYKAYLEYERGDDAMKAAAPFRLANPLDVPLVEGIHLANHRIARTLRERWERDPDATLHLHPSDLERATEHLPPTGTFPTSVVYFVQPFVDPETGDVHAVSPRGAYNTGFGKAFSRFLYLLPSAFTDDVRTKNGALQTEGDGVVPLLFAEISEDDDFNPNLHPPTLEGAVNYLTGDRALANGVDLTDLVVRPDPEDPNALALVHKFSGRRVHPVDMGYMTLILRPPLYQLLAQFSPLQSYSLNMLPTLFRPVPADEAPAAGGVRVEPRIQYRSLVLRRRRWVVDPSELPTRKAGGTDFEYFRTVDRWRRALDIPDRVFFRVHSLELQRRRGPGADQVQQAQARPHDEAGSGRVTLDSKEWEKPHYMDFTSPLLLPLFERIAPDLESYDVVIEEALPAFDQLTRGASSSDGFPLLYASELLLEIDFTGSV